MTEKALKFLMIAVPAGIVLAVAVWYVFRPANAVAVVNPIRGPAVQAVYATGTVEPLVMLPIAPRISSRLMELLADEGQRVEKSAILARLEDADIRKDLDDAQARAALAKKEYDRKAALVKSGAISRQSYDQEKKELESAQAVVAKIEANLSYLTLVAPDAGTVIRRDGEVGQLIAAGEPVFWLAGTAMRVAAEVDEEDIALVAPGQKVLIHADAFPEDVFEGQVQSITPKGDPVARSYRVRISLSPGTKLMTGMTAEANIVVRDSANAILIPASAVQDGTVWIAVGSIAKQRKISIGARNANAVEILEGVLESDLVIKDPAPGLTEGKKIRTRQTDWAARL